MDSRVFIIIGLAILVNIFLFALLPNFVRSNLSKSDLETIIPVNLVKITPPKPPLEKKERPQKKPPTKVIPKVAMQHKISKKLEIKMNMPNLSFEINPKLSGGMPVAPPAKGPTVFPRTQRLKDFYHQAEVDQTPMAIFKIRPLYPYRARRLNINGKVDVKFLVNEKGYVSNIKILKSTPPGIFDDSVRKTLPSWKFSPGKIQGNPVSTWVITTIEFKLEGA